jgi:predicted RND superfamily exporter protein
MWRFIARFTLRNRITILIILIAATAFMGYHAQKVEITYNFAKLLPDTDSASIDYEFFKSKFGQDGNILVVGIDKKGIEKLENFNAWYDLGESIKKIQGIQEVVSIARLNDLTLNDSLEKFDFHKLITRKPASQQALDTILKRIEELRFYQGIVFNPKTNATLMAITFRNKELNTKKRLDITDSITIRGNAFAKQTGLEIHYSGLPYVRTNVARKIQRETTFFLIVAIIVTGILLFIFFRTLYPVIFSLIVVIFGVIWSVGSIVLMGYKLSVLMGLIPPLIIVIGVPNCILLLNKYQSEFARHGNKMKALHTAVERISVSLFFANFTTAIGFAVFCAIENKLFFEFGLVASLNVMATYIISLLLIPIFFSFLPDPSTRHLKHLEGKQLRKILSKVDVWTQRHRKLVYLTVIAIALISIFGVTLIKSVGFVVDDLPKKDPVLTDLHYFESNYGGVLPFEITLDTKKEGGVFGNNARLLYKMNRLQNMLGNYEEFSRPVSVVEGVKFFYQAYKDGEPKYYKLPSVTELIKVRDMVSFDKGKQSQLSAFIDSTRRFTRISVQMKDVGSVRIKALQQELKPRIDSLLNYDSDSKSWLTDSLRCDFRITGNSIMFLKGNDFLIANLLESVVLAIILIAGLMLSLFTSWRMILISTIPSLVALLITAGLMGFLGIPLKTSTILVFSIAFGISSDGTLYFLTKYRFEVKKNKLSMKEAVSLTIGETGVSMIYTAMVLFFGFGMFSLSGFGGTQALGILLSFTLLVAYCSNLILLPAFLLSLEKNIARKAIMQEPLIEVFDEEEDIDLDKLEIKKDTKEPGDEHEK